MAPAATTNSKKNVDEVEVEIVDTPVKPAAKTKRVSAGKKRKADDDDDEDAGGDDSEGDSPAPKKKAKKATGGKAAPAPAGNGDPFSINLDGDEDETVPILDSCDELRKKINVHLDVSGDTKAKFLQNIARAGWPSTPPKIQSKQLTDFQTKKGATAGSTSKVCYGAYVYFEKVRLAKGEKKSRHRNGMEKQWGEGGMQRSSRQSYWCLAGEKPVQNAYGAVSFK